MEIKNNKIGILIPTFNRCRYLKDALNSAREQTHGELEIIVIDNGSTDGTAEFMSGVSDPRVRYAVNEKNIGMIGSINRGINLFSNDTGWCTILGDDDLLDKKFVETLFASALSLAAKSIIHSHRIFIDRDGKSFREAPQWPRQETAFEYLAMRANSAGETYLTGALFNRKAFAEIKGYPDFSTGLASDDAFIFALSLRDRLLFEPDAVAFIRIHEEAESATGADGIKKLQTIKQFAEYCISKVNDNKAHDRQQLKDFQETLHKFVTVSGSLWWIKTAHFMLRSEDKNREDINRLLSLAAADRDHFSFRIKVALASRKLTGIFPERYRAYRACWDRIINLSAIAAGRLRHKR
jgi:glycosyltransferase involved in cell wall biosynthesis